MTGAASSRMLIAAVLIPASLLVHESSYLLAGSEPDAASHELLWTLLPVLAVFSTALLLAGLLEPALSAARARHRAIAPAVGGPDRSLLTRVPFVLGALFLVQELTEALVFGGGAAGLTAAAPALLVALPLSGLIGLIAAAAVELLRRTARTLWEPAAEPRARRARPARRRPRPVTDRRHPISPLAFGLARRPPPALS